ncbi:MAG: hypothetical protein VST70_05280 [Nitrospirota bacterium]|nr:hypothetical protein [Nitrospirota bacterium]
MKTSSIAGPIIHPNPYYPFVITRLPESRILLTTEDSSFSLEQCASDKMMVCFQSKYNPVDVGDILEHNNQSGGSR